MTFNPGEILLNKYRIEKLIGRGAFAEVYRASHIDLNVPRALKVMRKDAPGVGSTLIDDYEQRFKLEVQLGARIAHPNVILVYDVERHGDDLILVMEYAPGGSLAERISEHRNAGKRFEIKDALQIATDVASGLGELHTLDAVHRDIKPSNILFDAKGRAKVADLGLAQVPGGPSMRSQLSQPMPHPGTPGYMSPEQERTGYYLRPTSDIYALGLMLFEMLTGRNYHNVERGSEASAFCKGLPAWLDKLLLQMLAENPDQRPFDGAKAARSLRDGRRRLSKRGKGLPKPRLGKPPVWAWFLVGGLVLTGLIVSLVLTGNIWVDVSERRQDTPIAALLEITPTFETLVASPSPDSPTFTAQPPDTHTPTSEAAPTSLPESSPTITPSVGSTRSSLKDGMVQVFVPAGEFEMGYEDGDSDEKPVHTVYLDAFWIDQTEVTNEMFSVFLNERGNQREDESDWLGTGYDVANIVQITNQWLPKTGYATHPVIHVTWYGARAYCDWAGRRLPTEAEWEKAARGERGWLFPWGGNEFDCHQGNFDDEKVVDDFVVTGGENCDGFERTSPIGSFASGSSPYGALDLAGNVWEWVGDWYASIYYSSSPNENPDGPFYGDYRVMRGGSWNLNDRISSSTLRGKQNPGHHGNSLGFRCAMDAEQ